MNRVTIVMYHYVRDLNSSRYPNIKGLDYQLFKDQIEFFSANYHIVTMEQVIEASEGKYQLPDKALLLTFDDGYIDHYTFVMPILLQYGYQGSFFIPGKAFVESVLLDVNKVHFILASQSSKRLMQDLLDELNYYRGSEYQIPSNEQLVAQYAVANRFDSKETIFIKRILQTAIPENLRKIIASNLFKKYVTGLSEEQFAKELYLNYDQIKCMKKCGMFIGVHGYDHYWLGNLGPAQMRADIDKAVECLDGIIDKNAWVMNYPYGSYNQEVLHYLQENHCKLGLTTQVRRADLNVDDRYQLPRFDTNDFPPKSNIFSQYL